MSNEEAKQMRHGVDVAEIELKPGKIYTLPLGWQLSNKLMSNDDSWIRRALAEIDYLRIAHADVVALVAPTIDASFDDDCSRITIELSKQTLVDTFGMDEIRIHHHFPDATVYEHCRVGGFRFVARVPKGEANA